MRTYWVPWYCGSLPWWTVMTSAIEKIIIIHLQKCFHFLLIHIITSLQRKVFHGGPIEDTGMKYLSSKAPELLLSGENRGVAWGICGVCTWATCFEFSVQTGSDFNFQGRLHLFLPLQQIHLPASDSRFSGIKGQWTRHDCCTLHSAHILSVIYYVTEWKNDTIKGPDLLKLIFYFQETDNKQLKR